MPYQKQQSEI